MISLVTQVSKQRRAGDNWQSLRVTCVRTDVHQTTL